MIRSLGWALRGADVTPWETSSKYAIPGYTIRREIGRGGQGIVFDSVRDADGTRCAVKVMVWGPLSSRSQYKRFMREVEVLNELEHPHVVRLIESGTASHGMPFLAMEFLDGEPLDRAVPTPSCRDSARATMRVVRQVVWAVASAHRSGIAHRDLKPSNVIVGFDDRAVVLDFGLARAGVGTGDDAISQVTRDDDFLGTLEYAAPEQLAVDRDDLDLFACDVYSLGVMAFRVLTGSTPSGAGRHGVSLYAHRLLGSSVPEARERAPWVDPALNAIVKRCLMTKPADRYHDAEALLADVDSWLADRLPDAAREQRAHLIRRRVITVAGVMALTCGVCFLALLPSPVSPPAESTGVVPLADRLLADLARGRQLATEGDSPEERAILSSWFERLHDELATDGLGYAALSVDPSMHAVYWAMAQHFRENPMGGSTLVPEGFQAGAASFDAEREQLLVALRQEDGAKEAHGTKLWLTQTRGDGVMTSGRVVEFAAPHEGVRTLVPGTVSRGGWMLLDQSGDVWWIDPDAGACARIEHGLGGEAVGIATHIGGDRVALWTADGLVELRDGAGVLIGVWNIGSTDDAGLSVVFLTDPDHVLVGGRSLPAGVRDARTGEFVYRPEQPLRFGHVLRVRSGLGCVLPGSPRESIKRMRRLGTRGDTPNDGPVVVVMEASCIGAASDGSSVLTGSLDAPLDLWIDAWAQTDVRSICSDDRETNNGLFVSEDGRHAWSVGAGGITHWLPLLVQQHARSFGGFIGDIAERSDGNPIIAHHDGRVRCVDRGSLRTIWEIMVEPTLDGIVADPDGTTGVTGGTTGFLHVIDLESGDLLNVISTGRDDIGGMAYAPDGEHLAVVGNDGIIQLWNTLTWTLDREIDVPVRLRCTVFGPDGSRLYAGGSSGTVVSIDVRSFEPVAWCHGNKGDITRSIGVEPETGALFGVSDDGVVVRYDPASLDIDARFASLPEPIYHMSVAPIAPMLATASGDGVIRVWDTRSGTMLTSFRNGRTPIYSVSFSRDGRSLLFGGDNGTLVHIDLGAYERLVEANLADIAGDR